MLKNLPFSLSSFKADTLVYISLPIVYIYRKYAGTESPLLIDPYPAYNGEGSVGGGGSSGDGRGSNHTAAIGVTGLGAVLSSPSGPRMFLA